VGWVDKHAVAALDAGKANFSVAPGAENTGVAGIWEAESLFLAKFQIVESDAPSPAAATGCHSYGGCARSAREGGDGWGAAGATDVADVCESTEFAEVAARSRVVAISKVAPSVEEQKIATRLQHEHTSQ